MRAAVKLDEELAGLLVKQYSQLPNINANVTLWIVAIYHQTPGLLDIVLLIKTCADRPGHAHSSQSAARDSQHCPPQSSIVVCFGRAAHERVRRRRGAGGSDGPRYALQHGAARVAEHLPLRLPVHSAPL